MSATRPLPDPVRQLLLSRPGRVASTHHIAKRGHDRFEVSEWVHQGYLDRLAPAWVRLAGDAAPLQLGHLAVGYLRQHRPRELVALGGGYALAAATRDSRGPGRPLVLIHAGRRFRVRNDRWDVRQCAHLNDVRITVESGLPLAEIPWSLADVAAEANQPDDQLIPLLYRVINRARLSPVDLVARWAAIDHPGVERLLNLAATGVLEHESPAELDFFRTVLCGSGPLPDCQVYLADNIRVDFVYLSAMLVIEYHGEDAHSGQVDRDATRSWALRVLGFDVIVITKSMLRDPVALARYIHRVRQEREELVARGVVRPAPLPTQPPRLTPLRTLTPAR